MTRMDTSLALRMLEQSRIEHASRPPDDGKRYTVFCQRCKRVLSYPYAQPGDPYIPVTFVRDGLCDFCKRQKERYGK